MTEKRGRPKFDRTPEQRKLIAKARLHMRTPRPKGGQPIESWMRTFLKLHELKAWEILCPPMTKAQWLKHYGIAPHTVRDMQGAMRVFDAAVEAGGNPMYLGRIPYSVLKAHRQLIYKPNKLLEALLGRKVAEERKRKVHNRAARRRYRASMEKSASTTTSAK